MYSNQLGQKIKELRIGLRMRQEDLAQGIVTRGYISQIEKGDAIPSLEILEKLAKRLHSSVKYLLTSNEETMAQFATTVSATLYQAEKSLNENLFDEFSSYMATLDNVPLESAYLCKKDYLYGRYFYEKQQDEEAKHHLETCIKSSFPAEFEIRAKAYNLLGLVLFRMECITESLQNFMNAFQLSSQMVSDHLLHIEILLNLGMFHCHMGELTSSITYLLDAYQESKSTAYKLGEILMTLGVCYKQMGNYEEAKAHYKNSLTFFENAGNMQHKAGILTNLGNLHNKTGNYDAAMEYLLEAIKTYTSIADKKGLLNAKLELAGLYINAQRLDEAEQLCNELIVFDVDSDYKAQMHFLLGKISSGKHNLSAALDHFFQAKAIYQKKGMKLKVKELFLAIGEAYYLEKDFESASYYFRNGIGSNIS